MTREPSFLCVCMESYFDFQIANVIENFLSFSFLYCLYFLKLLAHVFGMNINNQKEINPSQF